MTDTNHPKLPPVKLNYRAELRPEARRMRKNMTPQESKLWYQFLKKHPKQFRRQKIFGSFIVDFYCAAAHLVIEVDGGQHFTDQGRAYDRERTWYLESLGLRVIRFSNHQIDQGFINVCSQIDKAIATQLAPLSQAPCPDQPPTGGIHEPPFPPEQGEP